jgi:AcrR family transcriptional regulator
VAPTNTSRRGAVRPVDKYDQRRDELAESALTTLGAMGYARASLREIANNSTFSHGVVHYYFQDKLELVIYSVRYYKARCVTRYDSVVSDSTTADDLVDAFAAKLTETIREEAPMHRLWYDLRTQSMFEDQLRDAVTEIDHTLQDMIWRVVTRYAELDGRPVSVDPGVAYGMLDGLFQQTLLGYLGGRQTALDSLVVQVRTVMPLLVA